MVALNLSFRKQFISLGGWAKSGQVGSPIKLSSKGALLPPVSESWGGNSRRKPKLLLLQPNVRTVWRLSVLGQSSGTFLRALWTLLLKLINVPIQMTHFGGTLSSQPICQYKKTITSCFLKLKKYCLNFMSYKSCFGKR